jgi:hypothetical protein
MYQRNEKRTANGFPPRDSVRHCRRKEADLKVANLSTLCFPGSTGSLLPHAGVKLSHGIAARRDANCFVFKSADLVWISCVSIVIESRTRRRRSPLRVEVQALLHSNLPSRNSCPKGQILTSMQTICIGAGAHKFPRIHSIPPSRSRISMALQ